MLRHTRGASMVEYVLIVGVVALVAASAFGDFDAAVRAALTKEPERTARLDGDDGQRNGPTAGEMALALAFANASQIDRPGGLRGGNDARPPIGGVTRSPPRDGSGRPANPGGTGGPTTTPPPGGNGGTTTPPPGDNGGTTTKSPPGGNGGPATTPPPGGNDPNSGGVTNPSSDPPTCTRAGGCSGDQCFVAGTPVSTPDGQRAIEQLRLGETVVAYGQPARGAGPALERPALERGGGAWMAAALSLFDASADVATKPITPAAAEAEWEVELDLAQGTGAHTVSLLLPAEETLALESLTETPVRQLHVGNRVLLENDHRGVVVRLAPSRGQTLRGGDEPRIVGVSRQRVSALVTVETEAEALETTPEHPFYVVGKGWTPAESLAAGDEVDAKIPSGHVTIRAVTPHVSEGVVVYNLLVEQAHVYRVGASALLVHNGICGSKPERPKPGPLVIPRPVINLAPELKNKIPEGAIPTAPTPGLKHLTAEALRDQSGITEDELAAVSAWTFNSDNFRSPLKDSFKKKHADLNEFLRKAPPAPGTVYRGLTNVDAKVIEDLLAAKGSSTPVHLGPGGSKDLASASSDPKQALDFASPNGDEQAKGQRVLLVIDQRSGVAIDEVAHKNFKGQKEVLLPAADFHVTNVERAQDNQGDIVIVHVREAP